MNGNCKCCQVITYAYAMDNSLELLTIRPKNFEAMMILLMRSLLTYLYVSLWCYRIVSNYTYIV